MHPITPTRKDNKQTKLNTNVRFGGKGVVVNRKEKEKHYLIDRVLEVNNGSEIFTRFSSNCSVPISNRTSDVTIFFIKKWFITAMCFFHSPSLHAPQDNDNDKAQGVSTLLTRSAWNSLGR